MARCISCRSDIIGFVQERFEGFQVTLPLPGLKQDNDYYTYDSKYGELKGSVHRFAMTALLYLFHDMQMERWPDILADKPWEPK